MAPLQLHRIHLAVLQHDLPRVRRLLHRKASYIDLQDSKGATPLMLAAFIGSAKLVTFLLKKRASWQTTDRMGNSASDYVRGPFADQMRDCYKSYMRNSSTKSPRQRRDLEEHLRDDTALETQYRRTALGTLSFRRHGSSVSISKLIATVKFAGPLSDNTTAGCIAAGGSVKPLTCAVSGWTTTNLPGALNGAEYTDMVRNIAEILEFDLPRHCYDTPGGGTLGENIGRFHAVCTRSQSNLFNICILTSPSRAIVRSCLPRSGCLNSLSLRSAPQTYRVCATFRQWIYPPTGRKPPFSSITSLASRAACSLLLSRTLRVFRSQSSPSHW